MAQDSRTVVASNPQKVFFPDCEVTKGELVDYYRAVADVMVPHVRGRPLTLRRFPDGIEAGGFYQKDASDHFPDWIPRATVEKRQGGVVRHPLCEEPEALVYLANQATVEFHVWPARAPDLDHPDLLVVDLDPPDDGDLAVVRSAARAVRGVLEGLGLAAFLKTSGSKGYHIVAPVNADTAFPEARDFARRLAGLLAGRDPERLTDEQRKEKRLGRVFLDLGRNAYGQHAVAPYSVRARPGAPVSTPIDWSELGRAAPRTYHLRNVTRRLAQKPDPWTDMDAQAVPLREARRRLGRA